MQSILLNFSYPVVQGRRKRFIQFQTGRASGDWRESHDCDQLNSRGPFSFSKVNGFAAGSDNFTLLLIALNDVDLSAVAVVVDSTVIDAA